ncbi:hypothetical protein AB1E18_016299 [Capra hircus]
METQMASLSLGRCSLWLLLLGLLLPSASAQALSYREAVLRAVGQLNEKSSEVNLYRLLELDPPPKDVEDQGAQKPVSFRVKETVCPRTSQQPPEQCDFKENGLVKQCVGTVSLDPSNDQFDLNCNELQSVRRLRPRRPLSECQETSSPASTSPKRKAMAKAIAIAIATAKARAKTMAKAIAITTAKARAKAMAKTTVIIIVKAQVEFSTVAKTNAKSTSIPADISHFKLPVSKGPQPIAQSPTGQHMPRATPGLQSHGHPKQDEDPDSPKRVSFRVKETVCPRTTQQPPEQCDFKENGLLKRCEGTVTLDQVRGNFDITCNNHQSIRITKQPWAPPQAARILLPSASARPFSYREAVLRAVDQFNERSAEANLYRLLELDPPPEQDAEDQGARKPVSFRVKETVCPRTSQQPVEQCDFRENGLVKQCVGTVTRYWIRGDFDITCNDIQSVGLFGRLRDSLRRATSPESPASPSAAGSCLRRPLRRQIRWRRKLSA